jgi:ketosteroid isomerase-like protein
MPNTATNRSDEAQITALLDAFTAALQAKDARRLVGFYARDAVAFDLAPPLRIPAGALRDPAYIQPWFDTWNGAIVSEPHDLEIVVGDGVAYAFGLRHMTGTKTDGERIDLWFRATACFRREDGTWKITHMHNSVPFAMDGSGRALPRSPSLTRAPGRVRARPVSCSRRSRTISGTEPLTASSVRADGGERGSQRGTAYRKLERVVPGDGPVVLLDACRASPVSSSPS